QGQPRVLHRTGERRARAVRGQDADGAAPRWLHPEGRRRPRRGRPHRGSDRTAMKFGIFYEAQLPRPWTPESEHRLFQDMLAQIELADRLGYDYAWVVEHHFLEEYSHMSAPEGFLGAAQHEGRFWQSPARNVVPKPYQKPHPPLWVACSNILTIASAGRWGLGALGFQFVSPEAARAWVNRYYIELTKRPDKLGDYPA